MVCVFTTTVVIPARIPGNNIWQRMGKRGFLLTEGQQKGGMYTIELEQDLNRNTNATKSKSDPKVAWKKKTTRERPYNFRLLEVAKMGIGYRDPNFKFPKWKTAFNSHANKDGDDVFGERWTSCIVHCTACGELLKAKSNVLLHPRLGVVICNKCMYVYKHGNFNINPETGSEEYCRWCGDGGTIMGCDHCNHVFCQTCIHRNFGAQEVIRINEVDDWSCFLCDQTKIQGLQDSAQTTMKYLKKNQSAHKKNDLSIFEESPIELFYPEVSKKLLSKDIVVEDISNGNEKEPIRASNYSRKKELPPPFSYVTKSVVGEETLHLDTMCPPNQILNCCSCEDDCRDPEKCECAKANDGSFAYNRRRQLLRQRDVIYECNYRCKCHHSRCKNRVVGRGRSVPLEVFKTDQCGWGVKTLADIPAGTFVCEYIGELITEQEAERRADPRLGDEYLLSLDTAWVLMKNEKAKQCESNCSGPSPNGSLDLCCNNQDLLPNQTWKKRLKISDAGSQLWRRLFLKQNQSRKMHLTSTDEYRY